MNFPFRLHESVKIIGGDLPQAIGKTGWIIGINPRLNDRPTLYTVEYDGKKRFAFFAEEIEKQNKEN